MQKDQFVYVTYIRTTPEKLWKALIEPEFTRQFWCDTRQESEWKPGASWKILMPDGGVADSGEVVEIEPHRWLVLKWRNEFRPELKAEGYSRLTYQLEREGKSVKLTVIHEMEKEGEVHRSRFEWMAAYSGQSQKSFGNRRASGRNARMAA